MVGISLEKTIRCPATLTDESSARKLPKQRQKTARDEESLQQYGHKPHH
jgi:hypothetical protein